MDMKPLPLPLRLAAGIAVSARDKAKDLPKQLTGLPITLASQMLQASMRLQQRVTELAIKGDEALSGLQPVEETPSWATFDEDAELPEFGARLRTEYRPDVSVPPQRESNGLAPTTRSTATQIVSDPWAAEEQALAAHESPGDEAAAAEPPTWLPDYEALSLPQIRARLRQFSTAQLSELLSYERATADRPEFSGMLERRIEKLGGAGDDAAK